MVAVGGGVVAVSEGVHKRGEFPWRSRCILMVGIPGEWVPWELTGWSYLPQDTRGELSPRFWLFNRET